ncbi:MAG TPA: GNAT family N-acetyltransferase [Roseiflexaceae bacterium]|nr:GNAT family N-acetyltransferase [Roseiflexaceae bacterium]
MSVFSLLNLPAVRAARRPPAGLPVAVRGGQALILRPVAPEDAADLAAFFGRLSPRTLYLRYFTPLPAMPPERASQEIARLMSAGRRTFVGRLADHRGRPAAGQALVAVVELALLPEHPEVAELALVVEDSYQRQGIGSAICAALPRLLAGSGLVGLRATALAENRAVGRLFAAIGPYAALRIGELTEYEAAL